MGFRDEREDDTGGGKDVDGRAPVRERFRRECETMPRQEHISVVPPYTREGSEDCMRTLERQLRRRTRQRHYHDVFRLIHNVIERRTVSRAFELGLL